MGLEPHLAAWQTLVLQKLLHLLPRSVCMTDVFFVAEQPPRSTSSTPTELGYGLTYLTANDKGMSRRAAEAT